MQKDDTLFRIAMVLVDGFALLSYATVVEPLRAANLLGERVLYEVCNIPLSGDTARSSGGAIIPGAGAVGGPLDYDLMLVVAGDNCIT
ncbi:MAG: GlxA family transcriptional regulator, partial [Rhodospirillales bacterium]|nr:GlxA family transcriptional regulator [Rhodospirillales bacterium]